jgi:membrane protease YdiL (CAAX protease family)
MRTGQASCREVVDAHLRRIEAVNSALNAVVLVLDEQALQAATAADRAVATGDALPALHGVPFTVKESIDLVGTPTTVGLQALAEAYPQRDAPAVERLRAAGAIPIGRTNCPGLAVRWHTDNELHGATRNPWDRELTPGASSGGEAAAIASGMSPLGLGSDGLGSLRWPAQCCGVTTLKPTLGRIPHANADAGPGEPIGPQITAVQGPMARHVADLRVALEVLAAPTWRDPWPVPAPLRGPAPTAPIRVAVVLDPGGHGTAPHVRDGVRIVADTLAAAGYVCDEAEPPSIDLAARTLLGMLLVLTAFSREFVPGFLTTDDILSLWLLALAAALPTAFFEELGWTGFATPELRRRYGVVATGLALGAVWGAWHYPVTVWGSATPAETVPVALFVMVALFSMLPPIRILMVWVYDRTESVLVAMLMHASLLAFWLMATPGEVMTPDAIAGWDVVAWFVVWAALLWALVAVVAAGRRRTARQDQHRTVGERTETRAPIDVPITSTVAECSDG